MAADKAIMLVKVALVAVFSRFKRCSCTGGTQTEVGSPNGEFGMEEITQAHGYSAGGGGGWYGGVAEQATTISAG